MNKDKEKLTKEVSYLEGQFKHKKEILEKMKEDKKNMQIQNQNNFVNNKPQGNQFLKQNIIKNNQINQKNIPNY